MAPSSTPAKNEDENVQICRSWLDVTNDPLNSTNQTADTFWAWVKQHYMKKIPHPARSFHSLKSRWQAIQRAVNKFHGCYTQIQHANQSGASHNDRLSAALKLYAAAEKKTFNNLQCYHVLANAPKWREYCAELEQKKTDSRKANAEPDSLPASGSIDLYSDLAPSDAMSNSTIVPGTSKLGRPIGNKRAKKIKNEENQELKWKEDLVKVHRDIAEQNKLQNRILMEQKDAMLTLADEAIMNIDTSKMNSQQQQFYEWKQKKIIDRIAEEQEKERAEEEEKATVKTNQNQTQLNNNNENNTEEVDIEENNTEEVEIDDDENESAH
ncbi:hypothetical protein PCANC_27846 [Puccinia coronata f. sp. avenae]|uniref:No apical meristem-associated C-terminal domain-containing protein n=1 Tax=Puccinia coronata f. sp. avenae TaxID=200324 RepID=A0A2N5TC77_9BASI|nr:hypothetical protein PCANC_27846 [Puccinia coronata f. sp. avenae]